MSELQAESVTKSYTGRRVVDGVSLNVNGGEVVGLLGPNGAGKTTTFHMMVGLVHPDGGKVLLNSEDLTAMPIYQRARAGLSYLPQESSVFRRLTVEENLLAILETLDLTAEEQEDRAMRLMQMLGVADLAKQKALTLSGGERRRVEIARAIASRPNFILLDEPFAGIDPITVGDIRSLVSHLKDRGIGVLVTDHNVRDTLDIVDRAYILYEGKVLREGRPSEIVDDETVRRVYLGERFSL
jgi:lipopolysaccharide export system ATP-binding protein